MKRLVDRRGFLTVGVALAGFAAIGLVPRVTRGATALLTSSKHVGQENQSSKGPSSQKVAVEKWLLTTGQGEIDSQLYDAVGQQIQ